MTREGLLAGSVDAAKFIDLSYLPNACPKLG